MCDCINQCVIITQNVNNLHCLICRPNAYGYHYGDNIPFEALTLAHAFYPGYDYSFRGDVHLNMNFRFADPPASTGQEIGNTGLKWETQTSKLSMWVCKWETWACKWETQASKWETWVCKWETQASKWETLARKWETQASKWETWVCKWETWVCKWETQASK